MNCKPLVSVIIIFLNAERFLQEAIESVLVQTYTDWELLLVDDGSTDRSTVLAQSYVEQYPRKVRYLEHNGHQNHGKSVSRNMGVSAAKGKYIAFLDADDVWLPHKLQQQVAILESQPEAAMVYGLDQYWYSWTGHAEDAQRDFVHALGVQPNTLIRPTTLLPLFLGSKAAIPCPTGILVRRAIFDHVGGFRGLPKHIQNMYEDQAFYAKVCLKAPIFASEACWDRYRQHPDASCAIARKTGQEHAARLFFLNWLQEYLREQKVTDTEVWQALYDELWPYRHPMMYRLVGSVQHWLNTVQLFILSIVRWILPLAVYQRLRTRKQGSVR